MIKTIFIIFVLLTSLNARENPFFPSSGEKGIPVTSNVNEELPPLQRATLTLPSTARVIEGVTVQYKSLDGSVHTQSIELDNTIDWHLPIFVSQSYGSDEKKVKKGTKSKKAPIQQVASKKIEKKKSSYKKIAAIKLISFYAKDKKLKVITKDRAIRDFLLVKPHRIVVDFKRDTDIKSFVKDTSKDALFSKIRIGNHTGYYRVVIELDGYYRYKMSKNSDGYTFTLR